MKRITTTRAVLAVVALSALASGPLFAQTTSPDSADPTAKAIEVFHGDAARTGYDPVTITLPLSTVWRVSGVARAADPASMVAEDDTVYYGSGTNLVAVHLTDGQQRWSTALPSDGKILSTPAISGSFLYVGTTTGSFYKISRVDGSIVWTFKAGTGVLSSPVVSQDMVYFGSQDTNCYALNADTGKVVWQFASNAPVNSPPSVGSGLVVFASSDYNLYAFSQATGRQSWSIQLPDDPSIGPPVISGSSVCIGAGQWIYSFTVHGGALRWKTRFDGNLVSSPVVGPNEIFAATDDNKVYGLSDRGQIRWTATVGAPAGSGILLTQNAIIVGTKNGALYAFDSNTGALNWDYAVQPDATVNVTKVKVTGQPIYVNGTLLALTDDGALTAFRHDGSDAAAPRISAQLPKPGDVIKSTDLTFSANVIDDGSGIDPSTVQFLLDGKSLPGAQYDADQNGVVADVKQAKALDLINGTHLLKVSAKDWRGNSLNTSWAVTVDRTLDPKGTEDDSDAGGQDETPATPGAPTPPPTPQPNNAGGGHTPNPPAGTPPPPPVF